MDSVLVQNNPLVYLLYFLLVLRFLEATGISIWLRRSMMVLARLLLLYLGHGKGGLREEHSKEVEFLSKLNDKQQKALEGRRIAEKMDDCDVVSIEIEAYR
jgi:hypothetical protein